MEDEEEPPPFWLQSTTSLHRSNPQRRRRSRASSLFLNTGVLIIVLLAAAVLFLLIVIPSVLSLARQVFNPSLVKSSWNSLNIVLVLFAIVCGFLGRKEEDQNQTPATSPMRREVDKSAVSNPLPWYDYQDRGVEYDSFGNLDTIRRLRRNSSSYPDLRQESPWVIRESMWRSYDDNHQPQNHRSDGRHFSDYRSLRAMDEDDVDAKNIEVDTAAQEVSPSFTPPPPSPPRPPPPPPPPPAPKTVYYRRSRDALGKDESGIKNIEMDSCVSKPSVSSPVENPTSVPSPPPINQPAPPSPPGYIPPPPSPPSYLWPPPSPSTYLWPPPSPPPPPPPPPPRRAHSSMVSGKKTKQTNEATGHQSKRDGSTKRDSKSKVQSALPPPPPPQPPPPPPPKSQPKTTKYTEKSKNRGEKRRGGVSVTKDFLTSFYHPRKRKEKQKRRSYENLEEIAEPPKVTIHRSKSTPEFPPPSPPPPPPRPPPPPPPPPRPPPSPPSKYFNLFPSKKGKGKKKVHSVSTPASPPLPRLQPSKVTVAAPRRAAASNENAGNGSESPLIPIPPPPPPPPFKMPSWKFVIQGDYAKIESNNNSPRSGYAASEEDDEGSPSASGGGANSNPTQPLFFPSPDVNLKADDFIARFRAKLKLEKMNSIKQKQGTGPSPLGPDLAQP